MSDTTHVYSAVQYNDTTFPYHESLRHAFDAVVTRLEVEGVGPIVGTIRVLNDLYEGKDGTSFERVVVDFDLDGTRVDAPAIPASFGVRA